jgi:hypothetical protein
MLFIRISCPAVPCIDKVDGEHASPTRGARSRSLSCFIAWFRDATAHLQALCERQCPPRQGCSCERPAPMCVPTMGTEGLEALESLHSLSCPRTQHGTHPPWTTGYRRTRQGQPATGRRWLQTRSACKGNGTGIGSHQSLRCAMAELQGSSKQLQVGGLAMDPGSESECAWNPAPRVRPRGLTHGNATLACAYRTDPGFKSGFVEALLRPKNSFVIGTAVINTHISARWAD